MSDIDARLDQDPQWQGMLQQMRTYLLDHYPDATDVEVRACLDTVLDPPASRRKHPKGHHHMSAAEKGVRMTDGLYQLIRNDEDTTAENLIDLLGWPDVKNVQRAVKRLGFKDFEAFKQHVLPNFPVLYLSCALVVCHVEPSRKEGSDAADQRGIR